MISKYSAKLILTQTSSSLVKKRVSQRMKRKRKTIKRNQLQRNKRRRNPNLRQKAIERNVRKEGASGNPKMKI